MNEPREARTRPSGTALNALFPGASAVAGAVAGSQCRLNFIFQGNPSKMVPIDSAWHFHSSCKVSADLES